MTTPQGTATTPQEQDYNRSSQTPQPPPGWPYNGPKDEPLFVSQSESERSSKYDSEDALEWPCICGEGHDIGGEWIHCEKSNCRLKWYHLACVDLIIAPPGRWICRQCRDSESRHGSKAQSRDKLKWPCTCGDRYDVGGGWIRCDKSNCRLKWYHLACVGLPVPPAEKWICRQCRGRMRKLSVAKPDPKKKGIAIKVTPKKGQSRGKSWRELSSDEGEEYKRKVDSSREVKILPGKTRSGAGKDAVYSEDESESTETEKTPQQKTRRLRPKNTAAALKEADESDSDADSQVETPGKNFDPDNAERSADIGTYCNYETDCDYAEYSILPTDPQWGRTPAPGYNWSSASSEDEWARNPDMKNADAERGTIENEPASPAEDGSRSSEWETVMDTDETAGSSDWETIVDIDETASGIGGSTPTADLVSNNPPVRSSGPMAPDAAPTLLSTASTMTGEASRPRRSGPVPRTESDQALMAALRGSWVGQYFA